MNPSPVPEEPSPYPEPAGRPPVRWLAMPYSSRRPWRRSVSAAVGSAVLIAALGVPLGLLWRHLAPGVTVYNTGADIVVNDPTQEQYAAADGWFTLLGLGFGLLVALAGWFLLRRDRGPFLLLGIVVGAGTAGSRVAPWIGRLSGQDAYEQWRSTAARGASYLAPPELHSIGPTLVPAFIAAIVLTLLAGWSNDPDLDHPGAAPGYGPNHAHPGGPYPDPNGSVAHVSPVEHRDAGAQAGGFAGESTRRDPQQPI